MSDPGYGAKQPRGTDHMSVGELRQWLAEFGEQNRRHFDKNQVKRIAKVGGSIRQRIAKIEHSLSASSSASVSSNQGPPMPRASPDKDKPAAVMSYPSERAEFDPAPTPIFRSFDNYRPDFRRKSILDMDEEQKSAGEDECFQEFRIVAIERLLEPPAPEIKPTSRAYLQDAHPWAHPSWHPNALRSVTDTRSVRTNIDEEDEAGETNSMATGRYTDPGIAAWSRKLVRRMKRRSSKESTEKSDDERSKGSLRKKLPMLLCKSVKEGPSGNPPGPSPILTLQDFAAYSNADMPPPPPPPKSTSHPTSSFEAYHSLDSTPSAMYNAHSCAGNTMTCGTLDLICGSPIVHDPFKCHMLEEATVSTWDDDSDGCWPSIVPGAVDPRLGDIFSPAIRTADPVARLVTATPVNESREEPVETVPVAPTSVRVQTSPLKPRPELRVMAAVPSRPLKESKTRMIANVKTNDSEISTSSQVATAVERLAPKKSAVQQRKEELQRQWSADRPPEHVKKVTWQVCRRTGTYKKKVVLKYTKPPQDE